MLTQKEMEDAFIPRNFRDRCAALLIPLNECRHENFGLPWKCNDVRLPYQKCIADECAIFDPFVFAKTFVEREKGFPPAL